MNVMIIRIYRVRCAKWRQGMCGASKRYPVYCPVERADAETAGRCCHYPKKLKVKIV